MREKHSFPRSAWECLADALRRVFIRFAASEARDGIVEVNATQSVESGIPTRSVGTSVSLSLPCRKAAYMLARKKTCVFCLFQVRQRDHTQSQCCSQEPALPDQQSRQDEICGIPQARSPHRQQPSGIDGETNQPTSEGHRKVLERRRSRSRHPVAYRLPQRWRPHDELLEASASCGRWATTLPLRSFMHLIEH